MRKKKELARKPVSVYKRPSSKKSQYRYYVKVWDENHGTYSHTRSVCSIATELNLDEQKFPTTSRTGAFLIGQELLKRSGTSTKNCKVLLADYCATFWDWNKSSYIEGRIARGLRIGKEHAGHCESYVKNYIRPAFPALRLSAMTPYILETFMLKLAKKNKIGNRSVNAILDAIKTPLKEAYRFGLISTNPGASVPKLGDDSKRKGIPTEAELGAILSLRLDLRIQCAIVLGATCTLRLGKIMALKLSNIKETTLVVDASWGKVDGLKETKTGKIRIVLLPKIIHDLLL